MPILCLRFNKDASFAGRDACLKKTKMKEKGIIQLIPYPSSNTIINKLFLAVTSQCFSFIIKGVKNGQKFGDCQEILNLLSEA